MAVWEKLKFEGVLSGNLRNASISFYCTLTYSISSSKRICKIHTKNQLFPHCPTSKTNGTFQLVSRTYRVLGSFPLENIYPDSVSPPQPLHPSN